MIENNFISDQCDTPHNIQSNTRCVIETKDHFCINFSSKLEKECLKNQATKEKSKQNRSILEMIQQNSKFHTDAKVVSKEITERSENKTEELMQAFDLNEIEKSPSFKSCISHHSINNREESDSQGFVKYEDSTDEVKFEYESDQNSIRNKETILNQRNNECIKDEYPAKLEEVKPSFKINDTGEFIEIAPCKNHKNESCVIF